MPGLTEPNQVGKREDLSEIYAVVDVKGTPLTSRLRKSTAPTNSEFDWQVDKYADHKTTGTVDGTDVTEYENHAADRARLGNYIQVFRRTAKVSRLAEDLSNVAGVRSEIGQAVAKKMVEIKRDMEATFLSSNTGQSDTGAVPYKTVGLGLWIDTTGPLVPKAVPASYTTRSGAVDTTATASLTETEINNVLTAIFDATGMTGDYVLYAGSVLRRRFTEMTRTVTASSGGTNTQTQLKVRNFNQSTTESKVTHTTTVYEGDYGTIEIVSSQFIGGTTVDTDRGYLLDMDKIHIRSKQKPTAERFPDLGGGPRIMIEAVAGLQVDNPIGLGKFLPA